MHAVIAYWPALVAPSTWDLSISCRGVLHRLALIKVDVPLSSGTKQVLRLATSNWMVYLAPAWTSPAETVRLALRDTLIDPVDICECSKEITILGHIQRLC